MDYKTFSEAHKHNRREDRHLVNLISTRVDKSPTFSLFLGAGASISSGVSPGSKMMQDWRRALYASARQRDLSFDEWLREQEWYKVEDEYSRLFEAVYDQPSQRRAYIENAVKNAAPGWGYAYLAALMERGVFNTIFTTNFDDLINEACFAFTANTKPLVCAHDSAVRSIRITSSRPKIIKLHGDFLYDSIKNTSSELQNLEANMREKFTEFAKEYGLVVLGYAGNDRSIMDLLDVLVRSDQYFRHGIYWCIRRTDVPSRRAQQLLRNDRVYWVEVDGFDEFLAELAGIQGTGLPAGIRAPHRVGLERVRHLADSENRAALTSHQLKNDHGRLKETLKRVSLALDIQDFIDGAGSRASGRKPNNMQMAKDLGDAVAFMETMAAADDKSYSLAADRAKLLCERKPNVSMYHDLYLDALVRCPDRHQEARAMLKKDLTAAAMTSSSYISRSHYALLILDSAEALRLSEAGLALHPDNEALLLHKAFALLQLSRTPEAQEIINDLAKRTTSDYTHAVICAVLGDMPRLLVHAQKAVVRGTVATEDILADVLIRPFWQCKELTAALQTVSDSTETDEVLYAACPPHPLEFSLHLTTNARPQVENGVYFSSSRGTTATAAPPDAQPEIAADGAERRD